MKIDRTGLRRILHYLGVTLLLWAVYAISVSLGGIFVIWVYVVLFAVSTVAYVILVRGNLSPPKKTPPDGVDPAVWEAFREKILALRSRYSLLPPIAFGSFFCLLLDYINFTWFGGIFL